MMMLVVLVCIRCSVVWWLSILLVMIGMLSLEMKVFRLSGLLLLVMCLVEMMVFWMISKLILVVISIGVSYWVFCGFICIVVVILVLWM